MAAILQTTLSNAFFLSENIFIIMQTSLKFVLEYNIIKICSWVSN